MARLRVFVANGGEIYDLFLERKKAAVNEAKAIKVDQEIVNKRKLFAPQETIGNVTMLNIGKRGCLDFRVIGNNIHKGDVTNERKRTRISKTARRTVRQHEGCPNTTEKSFQRHN